MNFELKVTLSADPALLAAILALAGAKAPASISETQTVKTTKAKPAEKLTATVGAQEAPKSDDTASKVEPANSVSTSHTLESLRAIAVPKSKAGKKDEIRAKLTELGYPGGLNDLQPVHFQAFYDYIIAL